MKQGLEIKIKIYPRSAKSRYKTRYMSCQKPDSTLEVIAAGNIANDITYTKCINALAKTHEKKQKMGYEISNILGMSNYLFQLHKEHKQAFNDLYVILTIPK